VEQCKINKQAQLLRQVPSNVTVVEINAGSGSDLVVIRCGSSKNPNVVTDIRSNPIGDPQFKLPKKEGDIVSK
jgi:hypothetical protein